LLGEEEPCFEHLLLRNQETLLVGLPTPAYRILGVINSFVHSITTALGGSAMGRLTSAVRGEAASITRRSVFPITGVW
jgi:hypothetical protein